MRNSFQHLRTKYLFVARILLTFFTWLMLALGIFAQDTLFMADGSIRIVKILQVNPDQIKYTSATNLDAPTHVVGIDYISKVVYENGTVRVYAPGAQPSGAEKEKLPEVNFKKNIVSFNALDLLFGSITISYERYFNKGYFGIKVPLSVGFLKLKNGYTFAGHGSSFFSGVKIISSGLDFNFYPFGNEWFSYFAGISCNYGVHKYNDYEFIGQEIRPRVGYYLGGSLNNGVVFNFHEKFFFSGNLGVGALREFTRHSASSQLIYGVNIGYKF